MDGIKFNPDADTHRVILRVNPHQDSQAFQRIVCGHLAEWVAKFRAKNRDYSGAGAEPHQVLGVQGQFADIWRKIWKLKKALWDGQELAQEQPEEILHDLIGHCFLTLDLLREEKAKSVTSFSFSFKDVNPEAIRVMMGGETFRDLGGGTPAPASEEEAYTAQRTARFKRQQQDAKDAQTWRVRNCGMQCAEGHTYQAGCANAGMG